MTQDEPSSATLRRILRSDLCSGCGLCAGISGGAVEVSAARDGFNRPRQNRPINADQERAIALACPGSKVAPWSGSARSHPYWGPALSIGVGHSEDAVIRHRGSSGGVLTALVAYALREGLVDAVVHVAPDPASATQNITAVSRTQAEIIERSGSRYAPSSPLDRVHELIETGKRYAFIGKPCDVSALRQLGHLEPRVAATFPLVLSFFCGGIPSRRATNNLLETMGVTEDELAEFRYRGDGWPGMATATRHDGTFEQLSYHESWGGHLSKIVQLRCKICPDAVGGSADLTCADAWYGDTNGYPLFDERDGRSAVLARTPVGENLLRAAIAAGAIGWSPLDIEEIERMQPSQARRKREGLARLLAMTAAFRAIPVVKGLQLGDAARRARVIDLVRSFAGLLSRLYKLRRR